VPAYEFPIEDILTLERDVIPLDGVDVFQRIEIDAIGDRVALAEAEQISRRLRISRTSVPRFLSPRLYAEAPQRPDELWAADITYVPTQKKRRIRTIRNTDRQVSCRDADRSGAGTGGRASLRAAQQDRARFRSLFHRPGHLSRQVDVRLYAFGRSRRQSRPGAPAAPPSCALCASPGRFSAHCHDARGLLHLGLSGQSGDR